MALLDLIVIGSVAVFAAIGLKKGFVAQVLSILALVVAWQLSRPVGKAIANIISSQSGTSHSAAYVMGTFIALLAIYTALRLVFFIVGRLFNRKASVIGLVNRLAGGFFGGAKAFAACWIILCVVAAFPQHFENKSPDIYAMLQRSKMGALINRWNPVKNSRVVDTVHNIETISKNPGALNRLRSDPHVAEFLSVLKRKLEAQAKDDETRRQIRSGDISTLMKVENIRKVILDPEVLEALRKVDLCEVLERSAKECE
ncbi:MAG TPA: CvpA family protein [Planctomycetota bacterium]|nr:CvpA family protein [Planctomycetota bacterium]